MLSAGQCAEGRRRGKLDTVGGRAKNEKEGRDFFLGVGDSMHQNALNVTKFQSLEEIPPSIGRLAELRDLLLQIVGFYSCLSVRR